tara:strand:+ start:881 stop:1768 length:888 start_codon:yes stop_codon:yes gene_type:complete
MNLLKRLAIFLISGTLLYFLLRTLDLSQVSSIIQQINYPLLLTILPVAIIILLIRILKLSFLLKKVNIWVRFSKLSKIFLIGIFYGLITPGKVGELGRAYYFNENKAKTLPPLLWEKLIDIFTLIFLSNITIFLLFKNINLLYVSISLTFILLVSIFLITNRKIVPPILTIIKISKEKQEEYLDTMSKILKKEVLLKTFFLSLLYFGTNFIAAFILLKSLDPLAHPLLIFSLPLLILFGNLPITISGLGLREFVTVYCFTLLGSTAELGFSFSIIWFTINALIPGFIGFIFISKK